MSIKKKKPHIIEWILIIQLQPQQWNKGNSQNHILRPLDYLQQSHKSYILHASVQP